MLNLRGIQSGFSLLEVIVASAILGLLAWQITGSVSLNSEARKRIDQQHQFLEVESLVRSNIFKALSAYIEGKPNCAAPGKGISDELAKVSSGASMSVIAPPFDSKSMPAQIVKRCDDQSQFSKIGQGIYTCISLNGASAFVSANDAYVEAFYGFWDPAKDTGVACQNFNDQSTPLRGAKLFYTIYWRSKTNPPKDGHFMQFSGVMYGQTKN